MTNSDLSILIIEDQTTDILGPYTLASNLGYNVRIAFDGEQGLQAAHGGPYDLIILDWNLPIRSGREFLKAIEKHKFPYKIILHSGEEIDLENLNLSSHIQILDVWRKPMNPVSMLKRIKSLRDKKEIK